MSSQTLAGTPARDWTRALNRYRDPSTRRSIMELLITAVPLGLAVAAMLIALGQQWYLPYALLLLPTAGLLLRLFMIQHDCGHGSFFAQRKGNDWAGRAIGVLTLTPYDSWRQSHAMHHATTGNLDRRGIGDIDTLTVEEYLARSRWGRLRYRLYRHPIVMFGIGPLYLFLLQNRFPVGSMQKGWRAWVSPMATNLAISGVVAGLIWWAGLVPFLLVYLPCVILAATAGVWLFYVQHQFEETHWADNAEWDIHDAALHGSSHYHLPRPLRWFTANIGIHQVHHLSSRIPYYRLPEVLRDHPELAEVGRLSVRQSLQSVRLVLWDREQRRLISFKEMRSRFETAGKPA